jgi:3-dehydroquinate dehydratase / shikimate dehydrogenase
MEKKQVRICVPVCESSPGGFEREIARAANEGDIIELRLDCLEPSQLDVALEGIHSKVEEVGATVIVTFRPAEQGGQREIDNPSRLLLFGNAIRYVRDAALFDLELDLCRGLCSGPQPFPVKWEQTICSHHDFVGVSSDLEQIYEKMTSTPAQILKIAVRADDVTDCLPVFHLLDRARRDGREMIAIAMGTAGIATRILGPSRGAFLTYGSLENESATAPGQLTAKELRGLYRIDEITRATQIMGLIGLPVAHSISPQIHNPAFAATGVDACYIPFEVRDVNAFLKRMVHPRTREIDWKLRGLSVTAPHKTTVIDQLDWIEPAAQEIGAVNTIVVDDDRLLGYNTDATAVLQPLIQRMGPIKDAHCGLIGAGGAARATLWSLRNQGVATTVLSRNQDRGRALAKEFGARWQILEGASCKDFDFVINATPLGTRGEFVNETPVTARQLRGARLAYDLVYNPGETLFLREGSAAGCDTLGGLEMLVLQAAEQFRLWTGAEASLEVMFGAAQRALNSSLAY